MSLKWKGKILLKKIIAYLFAEKTSLMDDETYTKLVYRIIFNRKLNLDAPKTYNEYLSAIKLKLDPKEYRQYADKYDARTYVAATVGDKYLNRVLGIYDSFDDIDFSSLPDAFALKCTHGSGFNVIVEDKNKLDVPAAKRKIDAWMKKNYYYPMREKQYRDIKPRIMCDEYLSPEDGSPLNEVKLYCIKGTVRFIMDNHEKNGSRYSNVYDRAWNRLDVTYGFPGDDRFGVPENAEELVEVAEKLAKPFTFVRVDLYNIDHRIVFSELTFCPAGGMTPFVPDSFDYEMGKYFES